MKLKIGLKYYDVLKVQNIKEKILANKIDNKIIFYPYASTINTYFRKANTTILITNLDYQVEKIYRDVPKNKIIHIKNAKKKNHIILIPNQTKEKIVVGSVLKIIN